MRTVTVVAGTLERVDPSSLAGGLRDAPVQRANRQLRSGAEGDEIPNSHGLGRPLVQRHVVGVAVGCLDHRIEGRLHLVGEPLAGNAPDEHLLARVRASEHRLPRAHDAVARGVPAHHVVNLLEDVAARPEIAQLLLPVLGQRPRVGRQPLGQPHRLQVLQAREQG